MAVDFSVKPIYPHRLAHDDNDATLVARLADGTEYLRVKHASWSRDVEMEWVMTRAQSSTFFELVRSKGLHTTWRLWTWDEREAALTEGDFRMVELPTREWVAPDAVRVRGRFRVAS